MCSPSNIVSPISTLFDSFLSLRERDVLLRDVFGIRLPNKSELKFSCWTSPSQFSELMGLCGARELVKNGLNDVWIFNSSCFKNSNGGKQSDFVVISHYLRLILDSKILAFKNAKTKLPFGVLEHVRSGVYYDLSKIMEIENRLGKYGINVSELNYKLNDLQYARFLCSWNQLFNLLNSSFYGWKKTSLIEMSKVISDIESYIRGNLISLKSFADLSSVFRAYAVSEFSSTKYKKYHNFMHKFLSSVYGPASQEVKPELITKDLVKIDYVTAKHGRFVLFFLLSSSEHRPSNKDAEQFSLYLALLELSKKWSSGK